MSADTLRKVRAVSAIPVTPTAGKCLALNCNSPVYKDGYCFNCYHDVHGLHARAEAGESRG